MIAMIILINAFHKWNSSAKNDNSNNQNDKENKV